VNSETPPQKIEKSAGVVRDPRNQKEAATVWDILFDRHALNCYG
jgi:hypothetical protein